MRYEVIFDTYGYWVIDTTMPNDGEACDVYGAFTRAEAQAKCDALNEGNNE